MNHSKYNSWCLGNSDSDEDDVKNIKNSIFDSSPVVYNTFVIHFYLLEWKYFFSHGHDESIEVPSEHCVDNTVRNVSLQTAFVQLSNVTSRRKKLSPTPDFFVSNGRRRKKASPSLDDLVVKSNARQKKSNNAAVELALSNESETKGINGRAEKDLPKKKVSYNYQLLYQFQIQSFWENYCIANNFSHIFLLFSLK